MSETHSQKKLPTTNEFAESILLAFVICTCRIFINFCDNLSLALCASHSPIHRVALIEAAGVCHSCTSQKSTEFRKLWKRKPLPISCEHDVRVQGHTTTTWQHGQALELMCKMFKTIVKHNCEMSPSVLVVCRVNYYIISFCSDERALCLSTRFHGRVAPANGSRIKNYQINRKRHWHTVCSAVLCVPVTVYTFDCWSWTMCGAHTHATTSEHWTRSDCEWQNVTRGLDCLVVSSCNASRMAGKEQQQSLELCVNRCDVAHAQEYGANSIFNLTWKWPPSHSGTKQVIRRTATVSPHCRTNKARTIHKSSSYKWKYMSCPCFHALSHAMLYQSRVIIQCGPRNKTEMKRRESSSTTTTMAHSAAASVTHVNLMAFVCFFRRCRRRRFFLFYFFIWSLVRSVRFVRVVMRAQ